MKPSEASIENPIRLSGEMIWIYYNRIPDRTPVKEARIRSEREMLVECEWNGDYFSAPLQSKDGIKFTADFSSKRGSKVAISCKLWTNPTGYLLFGTWIEGGEKMDWLVELQE